ncbi:hypothetical protein FKW77_001408 [Venturia effusa]|uniref:YEATS domain-containing protein n=1 Tax=Venturia effusa TaxID=50376 RepID=A0A517LJQ2_9PEZI|nr:hypothetical protein FKW77_001408 [Venturia effusa]
MGKWKCKHNITLAPTPPSLERMPPNVSMIPFIIPFISVDLLIVFESVLEPILRGTTSLDIAPEDDVPKDRTGSLLIKREVKIITEQQVLPDVPEQVEGFPMRAWNIELWLIDDQGQQVPATVFEKVMYELHPTFAKPKQTFNKPPFRISEQGWGEFDITIHCTAVGQRGQDYPLQHDLNFQSERYEAKHFITFRNPKPELIKLLSQSGPVGENGAAKKAAGGDKKKGGKREKNVDMEKLADGLQKLQEDDLLAVVQMVHDGKDPTTYTKNDVENGEFHVDLYTLPDTLVKQLWDFTASKVEL